MKPAQVVDSNVGQASEYRLLVGPVDEVSEVRERTCFQAALCCTAMTGERVTRWPEGMPQY